MRSAMDKVPVAFWQLLLLGLLGVPGVLFIPIIMGYLGSGDMASLLVMQVYSYYLVVVAQYGYFFNGPAKLAHANSEAARQVILLDSLSVKLKLFWCFVVFGFGLILFSAGLWQKQWLLVFSLLLFSYAMNSNWYLQTLGDFRSGVLYAAIGLGIALSLLLILVMISDIAMAPLGLIAVFVLIAPQTCLGLGSWRQSVSNCTSSMGQMTPVAQELKAGWPLVSSQLLALATSTLGTIVVRAYADDETTVAYAATEKLFNLGVTVVSGLYIAAYPQLAQKKVGQPNAYLKSLETGCFVSLALAFALLLGLKLFGGDLLGIYLGSSRALLVESALAPFGLWLGLTLAGQILIGHWVIGRKSGRVLGLNLLVLLITLSTGLLFVQTSPVNWVWGMVIGQGTMLLILVAICKSERQLLRRQY